MGVKSTGVKSKIIGESLEIVKDTAKKGTQIPKQMVDETKKHLTGAGEEEDVEQQQAGTQSQQAQDTQAKLPKKIGAKKLKILKKRDDLKKRTGLADARQRIARYQKIQRQIQEARRKREEEVPAYIAGKPGEVGTLEEREEQMKKLQLEKEEKERKKKKEELLPEAAKRKKGTKERVKIITG